MKKHKAWRRCGTLLAAAVLSAALWAPGAMAADDIKMTSTVGWDGTFKMDALTYVDVTIDNQGPDMIGTLSVGPSNGSNGGDSEGQFEKEVVIPKGSAKTFRLEVPGGMFRQTTSVRLRDQKGNEVKEQAPSQSAIQEGILLGGLTEKKDDLNVFSLVSSPAVGGKINSRWMQKGDVPDKVQLLQGLDVLAINHAPKEKLTDEQLQAIHQWVESGGTLLLSGGQNYQGGAGLFQDISPVQVNGSSKVNDLSDLQRFTGVKPSVNELNISTGTLVSGGQVLVKAGNYPLLAMRDVGAGHVFYAAYDLSEEPFASWQGNKDLWGNVWKSASFRVALMPSVNYGGMGSAFDQHYQLVNASQMFRDLIPDYKKTSVMFVIYLIFVGPVLYFVLRRMNRRDWGWVLIPATTLLFTGAILLLDNGPRAGTTRAQTTAVINLKTDKLAEIEAGSSFLVTSGGNYEVGFKANTFAYPFSQNYMPIGGAGARTVQGDENPKIRYENVEYWSMRSSFMQGTLSDQGRLQSDLRIDKSGSLVGSLVNNTKFDFESTYLLVGNHSYQLDAMKAGATLQVQQPIQASSLASVNGQYGWNFIDQMFPATPGPSNGDKDQYRNLVWYTTTPWQMGHAQMVFVGFTKNPLGLYTIDGQKVANDTALSLVRQDLSVTYDAGGTLIPTGMIQPQIVSQDGQVYMGQDGLHLALGSVTLQYDLKSRADFQIDTVTTNLDSAAFAMYEKHLYNFKTGEWVPVAKENTPTITGDLLAQFVSDKGELRVKLASTSPQDLYLQYPSVGLEGKVSQ